MTLTISQLRERIAPRFPTVEQVGDSVVRFTKESSGRPYAVCYVDIAQDLPASEETLRTYQDRVIGRQYFEGDKSLQWNNYLYFVTTSEWLRSSEALRIKELIERDREYARKSVISEEELEEVLAPPVVASAPTTPRVSILAIWTEKLASSGLDKAVVSDDNLPARLRLIEEGVAGSGPDLPTQRSQQDLAREPFIQRLILREYRPLPLRREYEFGRVNLFFGANGSGKTSLLEAIELFYCGQSKRNPNTHEPFCIEVAYADSRSTVVTADRELQLFRDRNLAWYGKPEIRTHDLYRSFAQFNFLDTDAAVGLMGESETSRMEENLSKLLVGPDASKVWRDIERVHDEVLKRLNSSLEVVKRTQDEIASLTTQMESASVQQESGSIRARLDKVTNEKGWGIPQPDSETFAASLVESLSELLSFAQQGSELDWVSSPITVGGAEEYSRDARGTYEKAEKKIAELSSLRERTQSLLHAIDSARKARGLANRARGLVESGLTDLVSELSTRQNAVTKYSSWLVGIAVETIKETHIENTGSSVETRCLEAVSERAAAESRLTDAQRQYADFSKLRDLKLNLAQELREIAARLMQGSLKPDECPLCHTQFEEGELTRHISARMDDERDLQGQTLLARVHECETELRAAAAVERALDQIRRFLRQASFEEGISVDSALREIANARSELARAQEKIEELNRSIRYFEEQGLSLAEKEEISAQLEALGYPLAEFSREAADRLLSAIDTANATSVERLKSQNHALEEIRHAIGGMLSLDSEDDVAFLATLSRIRERIAATEGLLAQLGRFSSSFPWPKAKPLAELVVEAASVRQMAVDLQEALDREERAKVVFTEAAERKRRVLLELAGLLVKLKRLQDAESTLASLKEEHSLKMAMEAALGENRAGIERIFLNIHRPAEFSSIGVGWNRLVRKSDHSEAKLSQISSGQRAAFALSIFLAQNAQLTAAPPVVLMDDPIAHVDDLNSLSFLDYVREVVLNSERQIFFTTANRRLAALFERKFDFLGGDLRRFDLTRET